MDRGISNIVIIFGDSDFIRVFDWIGRILLESLVVSNICSECMLCSSGDIERFVYGLLPVSIEFSQYRVGEVGSFGYRDVGSVELLDLCKNFKSLGFSYNCSKEFIGGLYGSEAVVIDLEGGKSFISGMNL